MWIIPVTIHQSLHYSLHRSLHHSLAYLSFNRFVNLVPQIVLRIRSNSSADFEFYFSRTDPATDSYGQLRAQLEKLLKPIWELLNPNESYRSQSKATGGESYWRRKLLECYWNREILKATECHWKFPTEIDANTTEAYRWGTQLSSSSRVRRPHRNVFGVRTKSIVAATNALGVGTESKRFETSRIPSSSYSTVASSAAAFR